jgi:hypothetical protein
MNVDWYDFWLNGYKDPDSPKAEHCGRWDELHLGSYFAW